MSQNESYYKRFKDLSQSDLDYEFIYACEFGHFDIVKYLLTSPKLKEHANIHARNDEGFIWACHYERLDIIKYLIFDMNIEKTESIQKHFTNYSNELVENIFKIRDLNQHLEKELSSDKQEQKKIKL